MTESSTLRISESDELEFPYDDRGVSDRLETILLPVGNSDVGRAETLADTAADIAGPMGASVHVLHVFTPSRYEQVVEQLEYDSESAPDVREVVERVTAVRAVGNELTTPLRDYGVTMNLEGRIAEHPGDEIVDAAAEIDANMIVVGGRRRTPTGKAVFGSTAQQILLDAPCPVTFVRDT